MSVSGNGLKKIRSGRSVCFFLFIFLFLKNVSKYTVFTDFSPFLKYFFQNPKKTFRVGGDLPGRVGLPETNIFFFRPYHSVPVW